MKERCTSRHLYYSQVHNFFVGLLSYLCASTIVLDCYLKVYCIYRILSCECTRYLDEFVRHKLNLCKNKSPNNMLYINLKYWLLL